MFKRIPTSLKYTLVASIMYLVIALVYPSVKANAFAFRGYHAIGGEIFLWFIPLMILYAYDTWKKQREIEE